MGRKKKADLVEEDHIVEDTVDVGKSTPVFAPSGDSGYDKLKIKWASEDCYQAAQSAASSSIPELKYSFPCRSLRSVCSLQQWKTNHSQDIDIFCLDVGASGQTAVSLLPHQSMVDTNCEELLDLSINAGGPVWASTICPYDAGNTEADTGVQTMDRYLVIGTSRMGYPVGGEVGVDRTYLLGEKVTGDNLVQIWRMHGNYSPPTRATATSKMKLSVPKKKRSDDPNYVPKQRGRPRKYPRVEGEEPKKRKKATEPAPDSSASEGEAEGEEAVQQEPEPVLEPVHEAGGLARASINAELAYCVAMENRGPVWAAEWCPCRPGWEGELPALGLVAVVNGDGTCVILRVPAASMVLRGTHTAGAGDSGNAPVLAESALRVGTAIGSGAPGDMVTCVAWSAHRPGEFACGLVDGSITLYRIQAGGVQSARAATLSSSAAPMVEPSLVPLLYLVDPMHLESQIPAMAALRDLQFCPYDENMLLATGQDEIKIWNLKDYQVPVFSKVPVAPAVTASWDPCGYGYYTGDCETTGLLWNPLWGGSFPNIHRRELYSHALHHGGIWGVRAVRCDDHSLVVTAASDGTVRAGFTVLMTSIKNKNTSVLELCRVTAATSEPRSEVSSSSGSGGGQRNAAVGLEGRVHQLPSAVGDKNFTETRARAWQSLDAVMLTAPSRKAASVSSAGAGAGSGSKAGKGGKGQQGQKGIGGTHTALPAELVLVAYGNATGLVRVHTFDPLRVMFKTAEAVVT